MFLSMAERNLRAEGEMCGASLYYLTGAAIKKGHKLGSLHSRKLWCHSSAG